MTDPFGAIEWYFSQEELDNIPNRKYMPRAQELNLRQQATHLIQDIGQNIGVKQLCINTAIVYMHRFYCFHPFKVFHRNAIAQAAMFLATKIEEQPKPMKTIIIECDKLLNRTNPVKKELNYPALKDDLICNESVLISTLGFDLRIEHPHTHIIKFSREMNLPQCVAKTSYMMATNSLHLTTMCLQFEPSVVACFCIHIVLKWSGYQIPVSEQGKPWYQNINENVTEQLLEKMTAEFFKIYNECPAQLKKRVDFDINQLNEKKSISSNNSSNTTTSCTSNTTMPKFQLHQNPTLQTTTWATTLVSNLSKQPQANNREIIKRKSDSNWSTCSSSSQNNPANWSFSDKHSNNVKQIDNSQSSSSSAAFGHQSNKVSSHTSTLKHPPSSSRSHQIHLHKNSKTTGNTKSIQPHDKLSNHKSTLQHPSSSHSNQNSPHKKSTITGNTKSNHLPSVSVPRDITAAIAQHSNSNLKPNYLPPCKKPSTFGQVDTKCDIGHNLASRSWPKTTPSIPTNHRTLLHGKDSYSSHSVTSFDHEEVDLKVQPSLVTDESPSISKNIKEVALEEEEKHLNKLSNSNSMKRNRSIFSPILSPNEEVKHSPPMKIPKMMPKNESISKISIPHLPNDFKMAASSGTQISTSSFSVSHLNNLSTDSSSNVTTSIKSKSSSSTHSHHKKKKEHKEKSKNGDKKKKKHHKHKDQDREKHNSKLKLETPLTADTI